MYQLNCNTILRPISFLIASHGSVKFGYSFFNLLQYSWDLIRIEVSGFIDWLMSRFLDCCGTNSYTIYYLLYSPYLCMHWTIHHTIIEISPRSIFLFALLFWHLFIWIIDPFRKITSNLLCCNFLPSYIFSCCYIVHELHILS